LPVEGIMLCAEASANALIWPRGEQLAERRNFRHQLNPWAYASLATGAGCPVDTQYSFIAREFVAA
jgi:hypothetical protein